MRPANTLDDTPSRLRKQSSDITYTSPEPTTLLLARESDLARVSTRSSTASAQEQGPFKTFKQTLDDIGSAGGAPAHKATRSSGSRGHSRRRSTVRPQSIDASRQDTSRQYALPTPPSGLRTPSLGPRQEPSWPCSPRSGSARSMPNSDDYLTQDEVSSQVLETDDEEDDTDDPLPSSVENSAPQLIMPSIHIPSRRPFTPRGERLGRVKIMVAGPPGSGKTSLIKSIVQLCEDIVHIDPLPTLHSVRRQSTHISSSVSTSAACTEVHASSRPYPKWWNSLDDNRHLKRRKSMGDQVLDRNICFVDTQTQRNTSKLERYMEEQLLKIINCADKSVNDLVGLMTGSGGGQVDLVLYLITPGTIAQDMEQMRRLSELSNVVPVIAKSDQLTSEQIAELKQTTGRDSCPIPQLPINFGPAMGLPATALAPYTISSTNGPDFDNMDASLLMSSEYVEPLVPSELCLLVDQIFTSENAAFLRHLAAKKLVTWHNLQSDVQKSASPSIATSPASIPQSPSQPSLAASGILVPLTSELSFETSNNLSPAQQIADTRPRREERLAEVRLSKWTSDLQKTMLQQIRPNISINIPLPISTYTSHPLNPSKSYHHRPNSLLTTYSPSRPGCTDKPAASRYQIHDPLGLMAWQDILRQHAWLTLQVVGSFGVMGGLAIWIARTWRLDGELVQWVLGND